MAELQLLQQHQESKKEKVLDKEKEVMNPTKALAAIAMMQKDEGSLLSTWISYHASIVGYFNIYIIDHDSSDPETINVLNQAEKAGCHIERHAYRDMSFSQKGQALEETIKRAGTAKAYFPLDCDEFICLDESKGISCDSKKIQEHLSRLSENSIYTTSQRLNNAPWCHETFLPMAPERPKKVFMTTKDFDGLDLGAHKVKEPKETQASQISYIHLHNKPYNWLRKSAALKLNGRVDITSEQALRDYRGPGWHLCPYLLQNKEEWIESLRSQDRVSSPAFKNRLAELMVAHPFTNNKERKLAGSN